MLSILGRLFARARPPIRRYCRQIQAVSGRPYARTNWLPDAATPGCCLSRCESDVVPSGFRLPRVGAASSDAFGDCIAGCCLSLRGRSRVPAHLSGDSEAGSCSTQVRLPGEPATPLAMLPSDPGRFGAAVFGGPPRQLAILWPDLVHFGGRRFSGRALTLPAALCRDLVYFRAAFSEVPSASPAILPPDLV